MTRMRYVLKGFVWMGVLLTFGSEIQGGWAKTSTSVPVTLLHTNDLHSRFRPERSAQGLGGIGRIKTTVDAIRRSNPNTFLLDGGDFSEGGIYYTEGAGTENLKIMDQCIEDAKLVIQRKNLKAYQTDLINIARALFEKRASHSIYFKERRAKEKFDDMHKNK